MRKQDRPAVPYPIVELDLALGGLRAEVRSGLIDADRHDDSSTSYGLDDAGEHNPREAEFVVSSPAPRSVPALSQRRNLHPRRSQTAATDSLSKTLPYLPR